MNKRLLQFFRPLAATGLICAMVTAKAAGPSAAPASVSKEADLTKVILKPEAEQRLRLKTVPMERKSVAEVRTFAGEVVLPLGREGDQLAPVLGGTLNEVLRLGELQVAADGRIRQAQVQVDAAKVTAERAQKMRQMEAGSVRAEEEAKAALALAEATLATAKEERKLLGADLSQPGGVRRVWVRVAVYSGESASLDTKAAVAVRPVASTAASEHAKPITGPPTANASNNTVDWYYELPGKTALRAGERVAVEIPTRNSKSEHLVIPFNAVLHDIHGGQWVYEQTGEHTYTRHRIQVMRVSGGDAVLASGPDEGRKIVTDGSAELFGTEFMTGK